MARPARVVREGLLQGARRRRRRRPTRRSRAPTASSPSSTTPTPTRAAEERFKEISAAYDVLGDAGQAQGVRRGPPPRAPAGLRRLRRAAGSAGPGGAHLPGRRPRRPRRPLRRPAAAASAAAAAAAATPGRGAARDLEAELHLSSRTPSAASTTSVNVAGDARVLRPATGAGAAPGTSPVTCPTCGGRGALDDNQGLFSLLAGVPRSARDAAPGRRDAVPDVPRHRASSAAPAR